MADRRAAQIHRPPRVPDQPADLVRKWSAQLRQTEPMAELDFSFSRDAITICDMRVPTALRYGDLYTRAEIEDNLHRVDGDMERRVAAFMGKA